MAVLSVDWIVVCLRVCRLFGYACWNYHDSLKIIRRQQTNYGAAPLWNTNCWLRGQPLPQLLLTVRLCLASCWGGKQSRDYAGGGGQLENSGAAERQPGGS